MLPKISIIIPFVELNKSLTELLNSCHQLNYPKERLEIILVYNSSNHTLEYLSERILAKDFFKIIKEEVKGAYAARNKGAIAADGELLFFTDSDCVLDKHCLDVFVESFRNDPNFKVVSGKVCAYKPETALEYFADEHVFNAKNRKFNYFIAGNGLIRRDVFNELGGFNASLTSGGDIDFTMRLRKLKIAVAYESKAIVFHRHRKTIKALFNQYVKYGFGWRKLRYIWKEELDMYPNVRRIGVIFVYSILSIFEVLIYIFGKHTPERKARVCRHFYLLIINLALVRGFYKNV